MSKITRLVEKVVEKPLEEVTKESNPSLIFSKNIYLYIQK